MWLLVERFTIFPLVVMGTNPLVVGGVDFPDLLAIGTVFGYCLHSAAILVEDGVGGVGAMAFFGQLDGSLFLEFDNLCSVLQDMDCLPATATLSSCRTICKSAVDIGTEISLFCRHIDKLRQVRRYDRVTFLEEVQVSVRMTQYTKEVAIADKEMDYTAIVFMGVGLVEGDQPDGSYGLCFYRFQHWQLGSAC